MKKYGLRIGDVGIEFSSIEERQQALLDFTKGSDVKINVGPGIVYSEGEGNFSVYDRDTKEVVVRCCICKGIFELRSCFLREYPYKYSYQKEYSTSEGYICDACFEKQNKAKKIFDDEKILNENKEE